MSARFPMASAPTLPGVSSAGSGGHAPPWPGPRPRLSQQLTAAALRDALDPQWQPERAAATLNRQAAGNDVALRTALGRLQRRSLERSTPVARRAAQALR